ncbi:hypothetical protein WR25_21979 [Diploscapter pachys]|uniref:Uncharacterized protein n=1 Tax=Diploscapter pachys TaxID=2018661 RepID=A0A2A2L9T3_9BILA|nr:hypothetical protein WR25_21979 [Diploscapter pachys]
MVYIGIDLGTTYSCVSVVEDGRPVVIDSDDGKFTIPSVVAYCSTEILVGNPALAAATDISNVLYDSKRLIGYKKVVGYVLNAGQQDERFLRPEEISAEILKKLKMIAERHLPEREITGAVVTVPAFFNNDQINATKRAIQMAGLDLKYLLEEPTAAAIAYYNKMRITDLTIMVFDWGGGTLDISIAEIKNEKFDVKSVCGDAHLGGQNFDEKIMKYVIEEFKKSDNYDMLQRPNLMKRLRQVCKEAKESLSFQIESWNVKLDINYNTEINVKISRSNFNQFCKDLFDKAMRMVEKALRMAKISAEQIDNVILVGGSTRIPKIQELLSHKFDQKKLRYNANPEEAVARGAAIIANALEKGIAMPLISNTMNELAQNTNDLQIGENVNPEEVVAHEVAITANDLEKRNAMPLVTNTMNELAQNTNNLQIGGDNLFNNSQIGGDNSVNNSGQALKSCLYFDPSAPVGSRISRIADMNHARHCHSLIVASEKLYAIGG